MKPLLHSSGDASRLNGVAPRTVAVRGLRQSADAIWPICSLVAPCQSGASPLSVRRGVSPRAPSMRITRATSTTAKSPPYRPATAGRHGGLSGAVRLTRPILAPRARRRPRPDHRWRLSRPSTTPDARPNARSPGGCEKFGLPINHNLRSERGSYRRPKRVAVTRPLTAHTPRSGS